MLTRHRITFSALAVATLVACGTGGDDGGTTSEVASADPTAGRIAFEDNCARCHGQDLRGTDQGPSFLDRVYEPGHHGDAAFRIAPRRGVQAHHWQFGDMPPIEGITDQEIEDIIAYVRQVQEQEGFDS